MSSHDSQLEISRLTLGSWHIYDRMRDADVAKMLRSAVERGITLFDVGVYGDRANPADTDLRFARGMAAAGVQRGDYLLSVKLWNEWWDESGFAPQFETALRRLDVSSADLVVVGGRVPGVEVEDIVESVGGLVREGSVERWAVNNWSAADVTAAMALAKEHGMPVPVFVQLKYSVARRSIAEGAPYRHLFDGGLGLQASDVLEGGILAGNLAPSRPIGRDDGGIRARMIEAAPAFAAVAGEVGATPAQLAIAFSLTHPAHMTSLVGIRGVEQLTAAFEAIALADRVGAPELRALVEPFALDQDSVDPRDA